MDAFPANATRSGQGLPWILAFSGWLVMSAVFLVPLWSQPTLAVRGDDYWQMSEWFASSGSFLDRPYPHSHFGPGYPLLIHLLRTAGVGMFGLAVLQKLMVAVTGIALYRLGRTLGLAPMIALAAAAAFTIFPVVQANSSLFFAETFYLMLSSIAVATLFGQIKRRGGASPGWLLLGYGLLGAAALVRGNALVLLAGCAVIGVFTLPWRKLVIPVAIAALPILGWSALNWHWYGYFKPTSAGDAALAAVIVGPVMTAREGRPRVAGPEAWIDGPWQARYANLFELAQDTRRMAVEYAKTHPGPVLLGNVQGWFKGLLGPAKADLSGLLGGQWPAWTGLSLAVRGVLLAGMLGFFVAGGLRQQPAFAAFLCVMLAAHILAAGAAGYSRFGFPVDAFSVLALALFLQTTRLQTIASPAGAR